jgi:hypothetical protein
MIYVIAPRYKVKVGEYIDPWGCFDDINTAVKTIARLKNSHKNTIFTICGVEIEIHNVYQNKFLVVKDYYDVMILL